MCVKLNKVKIPPENFWGKRKLPDFFKYILCFYSCHDHKNPKDLHKIKPY